MALIWVLVAVIALLLVWIRVAPSDVARWHVPVEMSEDKDFAGGAVRVIPAGAEALARLDAVAQATPRTSVLAGSVDAGRVTYVTRSRLIGFPDYTTAEAVGGQLRLYARLRFGRSDLGVNRARLEDWLARL